MGGREQDFIKEAFDTNWVVPLGPNVDAFEKALADYLQDDRQVVALSAGTAALHLGLILLGVKPGDEVICQSFTFAASANPISYLEAKPVFVDSEKDTWNMDPVLLEEAIKDRLRKTEKLPKAIIPVHLYGMPAKMDEIMEIAHRYDIPVLEDAAEALGSKLNGQMCGVFGELAALSFNGNKMITTSGGGALICRTEEEAKQTKFYATQARDAAPHYQHTHIGYNYRMPNINAALGCAQMENLDRFIDNKRETAEKYKFFFKDTPIEFFSEPEDCRSNYWLNAVLLPDKSARDEFLTYTNDHGVMTRPIWGLMNKQPMFVGCQTDDLTNTYWFEERVVNIPSSVRL